jgi:hypothetical protein
MQPEGSLPGSQEFSACPDNAKLTKLKIFNEHVKVASLFFEIWKVRTSFAVNCWL